MYDAFISYSHAADGRLAPALQAALHRLGKPWYKVRALRVFRDKTSLSATPALWPTIVEALKDSRWFLLMASPDAARSPWVRQEIDWWLENRDAKTLLILLTGGDLVWDRHARDFDWAHTSALPESLADTFRDEPLYVDLRRKRDAERLTLRDADFRASVLDIAAPVHGRAKDELDGEDVRQHRKTRRLAWAGVALLVLLTIASLTAAYAAIQQRNLAVSRELGVFSAARFETDPELSILLAMEGLRRARTDEAEEALRRALVTWPLHATIAGRSRSPAAARFSPDGTRVITAWQGGTARICDADTGDCPLELAGHAELVQDAVFSPDGQRAATASWDRKGRIWDAHTGKLLRELPHRHVATSVRFSPDGAIVATGSGDGTAYLWDGNSGRLLAQLQPNIPKRQFSFTTNVVFSPDGKKLVTSGGKDISFGADEVARIWSVPDGALLHELRGHKGLVTKAEFSPDGRTLATVSDDRTLRLWDPENGSPLDVYEGAGEPLVHLAFHPAGQRLVTTTSAGSVQLWNLDGTHREPTFRLPDGSAGIAAFSRDGRRLLTAGYIARVWDLSAAMAPLELRGVRGDDCCAEFRPDGKAVLTGGGDGTIRIWNIAHPHRTLEMHVREGGVTQAGFNADGRSVLTSGLSFWVLWDAVSGKPLHEIKRVVEGISAAFDSAGNLVVAGKEPDSIHFQELPGNRTRAVLRGDVDVKAIESAMLSPDGNHAATSGASTIQLWDAGTGQKTATLAVSGAALKMLAFSPSSRQLLTADIKSKLTLWDTTTGKPNTRLPEPAQLRNARFSPDGSFIVAAPESNNGRIWDVERGTLKTELVGHTGWLNDAVFRADGRQVLTSGSDKTARLWDFPSGRLIATMSPPGSIGVEFASYSPDGRLVVTAGAAFGAIHIWNGRDGTFVAKLQVTQASLGTVNTAVFSPDGRAILTASNDGIARIFPVETFLPLKELLAIGGIRAKRPLGNRERYAYLHEGSPEIRPD